MPVAQQIAFDNRPLDNTQGGEKRRILGSRIDNATAPTSPADAAFPIQIVSITNEIDRHMHFVSTDCLDLNRGSNLVQ